MDAATRLGPCDDPALWSREVAASSATPLRLQGCGPTNLARAGFEVSAPEACFRVTEAGPATGYVVGTTWRATAAGSALVAGFDFSVRVGAGPLELTARYVRDGELFETVATLEDTPRVPLFEGIRDFVGFGRQGRRSSIVVTAFSVLSTDGEAVPISGRGLDAAWFPAFGLGTVVLVDTPEGRVLEVLAGDGSVAERIALAVSPTARFVRGATALVDDREVVLLDPATLREAGRVALPDWAATDFVVPSPGDAVLSRTGQEVWRLVPGGRAERAATVSDLRRLVPLGGFSQATTTMLLGDDAFGFLERLDRDPPALDFALAGPLDSAPFLATPVFWVSEAGFAWFERSAAPQLGPMVDDMWAIHGGLLVDVAGDGLQLPGTYAVARPDETVDVYEWSAGVCSFE
ncbi:MAG: hypothetical protein AAF447_16540 [Myxococcota bacterium]